MGSSIFFQSVRKVRKGGTVTPVTPTPKTELVDIGGQKWAKTNVSAVYKGLFVFDAKDVTAVTAFVSKTNEGEPACFKTPAGDMLYNMYVDLDKLLPETDPTMTVPTKDDLQGLASYYEDNFKAGESKEEHETAMRDRVDAIKNDLGVKLAGIFVIGAGGPDQAHPDFEGWWAHDKSAVFQIMDSAKGTFVGVQQLEDQRLGLSVRLIQKPTAA